MLAARRTDSTGTGAPNQSEREELLREEPGDRQRPVTVAIFIFIPTRLIREQVTY